MKLQSLIGKKNRRVSVDLNHVNQPSSYQGSSLRLQNQRKSNNLVLIKSRRNQSRRFTLRSLFKEQRHGDALPIRNQRLCNFTTKKREIGSMRCGTRNCVKWYLYREECAPREQPLTCQEPSSLGALIWRGLTILKDYGEIS